MTMLVLIPKSFGRRVSMTKDIFGFEKAIQMDHLSDEQINLLDEIFKDFK